MSQRQWLEQQTKEALEGQRERFRAKFGRDWRPDDPIFFDPDADEPRQYPEERMKTELLEAMRKAGTPPEIIYAFKKTDLLLVEASDAPPHLRKEWNDAIAEYFELERKAEQGRD
jgi:hypothetical protein